MRGFTVLSFVSRALTTLSLFYAVLQSCCGYESFIKLNLPIPLMLVRQQEKSPRYFDLLTLN